MCADCQATFNNEAKTYDKTLFVIPHYHEVINGILSKTNFPQESSIKVLDLGCGTGNLSQAVLEKYPHAHIYAVDFSDEMLSIAKEKLESQGLVEFIHGNIFELDPTNLPYFDLIVSSFVLHNYEEIGLYEEIFKKSIDLLGVDGRLIIGDLIKCGSSEFERENKTLRGIMKVHGLTDEQISTWFKILDDEDSPLPVEKIIDLLTCAGFVSIEAEDIGCTAVFSAIRPLDVLQVKAELLVRGIKKSPELMTIFYKQNPNEITKTGNNGVFLTLNNKYQVLASFLHGYNSRSTYMLNGNLEDGFLQLYKHGHRLDINVADIKFPNWYSTQIDDHTSFPSYFVLEGEKYLHLAYKSCSFSESQRCKFCAVKRREKNIASGNPDHSAKEVCTALEIMFSKNYIPEEFHFCLGGGTYLPLSENVDFFCEIIKYIRGQGARNPIWVEMIPPSQIDLRRLIDAGATSFGFNIEVLDDKKRQEYCPGKYEEATISQYKDAFTYASGSLGTEKLGSCIIIGLNDLDSLKRSVDYLIDLGIFPCVLPLKEFDGMQMELSLQAKLLLERHFMEISQYAADQISKNRINIYNNEGCMNCTCCTVIHDLLERKGDTNNEEDRYYGESQLQSGTGCAFEESWSSRFL